MSVPQTRADPHSHQLTELQPAISLPVCVPVFTYKPHSLSPSRKMSTRSILLTVQTILNTFSSNEKQKIATPSKLYLSLNKIFYAIKRRN